jgi:hypothetical protein
MFYAPDEKNISRKKNQKNHLAKLSFSVSLVCKTKNRRPSSGDVGQAFCWLLKKKEDERFSFLFFIF